MDNSLPCPTPGSAGPTDAAAPRPEGEFDLVRFFELSLDLFCIANLDGYFLRVNANFSRVLGFPDRELLTRPFLDFVHPDDRDATIAEMSKLSSGLPVVQFRNRYRDSRGEHHWFEWTARSVPADSLIYAVARDITEARHAEAQRIARVGSWEWRVVSDRSWWSDEYFHILGYNPGEVMPSREAFMARVHPDDRALIEQWLEAIAECRVPENFEFRIVRPDGNVRTLWSDSRIERDAQGNPHRILGTIQDITERKLALEEKRLLERRLQEAQKLESLAVLAGGVAHDFNNLLAAILGNASMIDRRLEDESALRPFLDAILQASERASGLCRQMLDYSGRGRLILADLDVNRSIREMIDLLKVSLGKKIELQLDFAETMPAIHADQTQLGQVIINLVINASEAIGEHAGRIRIATHTIHADRAALASFGAAEDLPEGEYVAIEIEDTGCGMDDATRRKIFDPFFTTKFTGRGLGLAAVLGIVRGHKGAIQVVSEPGVGSTFRILLPASANAPAPQAPSKPAAIRRHGGGTILIVDDDDLVRETTAQILQELGYETVVAADGEEALVRFHQAPGSFRLVLLDLTMPKLDGEDVFRAIRAAMPKIPVVMMSGFSADDIGFRSAGSDPVKFLAKPFTIDDLARCIEAAIGSEGV